jgi:hypothetical protein
MDSDVDSEMDSKMDWAKTFGLDRETGWFQSLKSVALAKDSETDARKRLTQWMQDELNGSCTWDNKTDYSSDDSSDDEPCDEYERIEPESKRRFVLKEFSGMIECERHAWQLDYFVFYRVVRNKYALYQFNTLMLTCFNDLTWGREPHRGGLICTPCLDDSLYPDSMEHLMGMFVSREIRSDSDSFTSNAVISVNNCLTPTGKRSVRLHSPLTHTEEASPMDFYTGYDETVVYKDQMQSFIRSFFETTEAEAGATVKAIFRLYRNSQRGAAGFKGHCLQICIPSAELHRFAYPCVSYGGPVDLYQGLDERIHAYKFGDPSVREREVEGPITLAQLLRRREMRELQARIIAHPNLFLSAGAVTNVFHANPKFDEHAFKVKLIELLAPLIRKAIGRGKRIDLSKFN